MKAYKLTDERGRTYKGTQWGEGVTHSGTGKGPLCGPGWIHYYQHPILAALLNPIHTNFCNPILWEANTDGECLHDGQLKSGAKSLTTVKKIPVPEVTPEQRIRFAILCALEVCSEPNFVRWANDWLSGQDRSKRSAWSVSVAASRESVAPAWTRFKVAMSAAWSAAEVSETAAAWSAAWTVQTATTAASAARKKLDLVKLAEKAMEV